MSCGIVCRSIQVGMMQIPAGLVAFYGPFTIAVQRIEEDLG